MNCESQRLTTEVVTLLLYLKEFIKVRKPPAIVVGVTTYSNELVRFLKKLCAYILSFLVYSCIKMKRDHIGL